MKRLIFMLMAACALLASSCEKPEELILQEKPQRSGDDTTTTVTPDPPPNPHDSILPPHIEKWIWIRYQTNYCVPHRQEFPPPENWFGPDA
ncbi:MAG: hypothetical protein LBK03_02810, partial [Bacteroidales bacterium]|nr:hypothetical protein [Bacteroidales bacterium]